MRDIAVKAEHLYKRFRRGELHDSLRDFFPSMVRGLFNRSPELSLQPQDFWALHDVDFEVARGEAFGVIGANGAGKSTLLKLLCGILRPTSGVLSIRGRMSALIEVSAGFHPDLSGRENVFLNGTILGLTRAQIRTRFDEIVEFAGLEEFIDMPVKRYSSGMYARLGFSVAAHVDPDILVVDEVLSVGDFTFQRKCMQRMSTILAGGATVIFVSHNLEAVSALCSRAMLLERGRVIEVGPSKDVVQQYLTPRVARDPVAADRDAFIVAVTVRGDDGPKAHFQAGDCCYVDVETASRLTCDRLTVVIHLRTAAGVVVFDTSAVRLGIEGISLREGCNAVFTFSLNLHLAAGTYYLGAVVRRYDTGKNHDEWNNASTLIIDADRGSAGIANLYPTASVRTV